MTHPKMMSVGLHLRLSGRPARANAVEEFIKYAKGFPDVWFTRRIDIARRWLASLLAPSKMDAGRKQHLEDVVLNTPQHVLVSSLRESYDPKIWTELRIEVPLLVINAKQPWFDKDYIDYVGRLGPDVDYQERQGVSHFLMMDEPEEFNDLLLAFLRKVGLASP